MLQKFVKQAVSGQVVVCVAILADGLRPVVVCMVLCTLTIRASLKWNRLSGSIALAGQL